MPLTPEGLEAVWSEIAVAIDGVPRDRRELFLAKLALALARELDDPRTVTAAIELAARALSPPR